MTALNPHLQGFDRLPLAHSDGAGQRFRAKAAVLAIEAVPVVKRLTAGDRLRGLSRLAKACGNCGRADRGWRRAGGAADPRRVLQSSAGS